MTSFASQLKSEIARVARKETKEDFNALRKSGSAARSDIAALKRRVHDLEVMVAKLGKALAKQSAQPAPAEPERKIRWSSTGFAKLRKRLDLSAQDMGKLLDVSAQTIYHWENAESEVRPRAANMPAILAARKLSKRQAQELLSVL